MVARAELAVPEAQMSEFLGREDDVEVVKTSRWTLLPSPPNATKSGIRQIPEMIAGNKFEDELV